MKALIYIAIFLSVIESVAQTSFILDATTQTPVSFATISFGDGRGTFAGADGDFRFPIEKYKDIDSLYISAIGYSQKSFSTKEIPRKILLQPEASLLSEVIVTAEKRGKFKKKKLETTTHTNYHQSWLPTVESEVAVFFEREEDKSSKIASLMLPINAEQKGKKTTTLKYKTFFRVQFYTNDDGLPGKAYVHDKIVFIVDEVTDGAFEVDLLPYNIFIPEDGIYASIQVLGYADSKGKLLQNKKYSEVETRRGIQKVSTTFRPLLPFSDELSGKKTFVRRIFFNNKKWQVFDVSYNKNSNLIKTGHNNYGMGALLHVYQD